MWTQTYERAVQQGARYFPPDVAGALRTLLRIRRRGGRDHVTPSEVELVEAIERAFRRERGALVEVQSKARRLLVGS